MSLQEHQSKITRSAISRKLVNQKKKKKSASNAQIYTDRPRIFSHTQNMLPRKTGHQQMTPILPRRALFGKVLKRIVQTIKKPEWICLKGPLCPNLSHPKKCPKWQDQQTR